MISDLIESWHIHNRINLYLLDAIPLEALDSKIASYSRSVAVIFAHLHAVRIAWIEPADAELASDLKKIPVRSKFEQATINHDILRESLTASGDAMAILLQRGFEKGRISGFKPHPGAFLAYLIAHEAHHRGEIGIILTESGHPLPKDVDFALWDWDRG